MNFRFYILESVFDDEGTAVFTDTDNSLQPLGGLVSRLTKEGESFIPQRTSEMFNRGDLVFVKPNGNELGKVYRVVHADKANPKEVLGEKRDVMRYLGCFDETQFDGNKYQTDVERVERVHFAGSANLVGDDSEDLDWE